MKNNARRLPPHYALLLGIALVIAALAVAEFLTFPEAGHRIDTTTWPIAAQAILNETPGTPITSEQWKRIDKVLSGHGDMNYGQRPYWSSTVRASWWWLLFLRHFWPQPSSGSGAGNWAHCLSHCFLCPVSSSSRPASHLLGPLRRQLRPNPSLTPSPYSEPPGRRYSAGLHSPQRRPGVWLLVPAWLER